MPNRVPVRLCKLPPRITYRDPTDFKGSLAAIGSQDGVVTILDVVCLLTSSGS